MGDNTSISQQILTTLGGGSGIDIFKLAQDLTDVEKEPKQLALEQSIAKSEASISGYAAVSYQVGAIKAAFQTMDDADELVESEGSSSNSSMANFTSVSGSAIKADYDLTISQLAKSQRTVSNVYNSTNESLNAEAFNISVTIGSSQTTTHTISVSTATPQGVTDAINDANIGISASLLSLGNSANQYRIILEGGQGTEGAFSVSSSPDLGFATTANTLQSSQNAQLTFNGLAIERSSNEISDLVSGATVQLKSTSSSPVTLSVSNGQNLLKSSITSMIESFNDLNGILDALTDPDSTIENGGALAGDYTGVRYVEQQLRSAIFGTSATSSGSFSSLRDIGISSDKAGKLLLDESKLDTAISKNFADVKKMLTANTNNQSQYSAQTKGLSQAAIEKLDALIGSGSVISDREINAKTAIANYEADLIKLEERMEGLYDRYLTQFSAMESLVRQMNSTRDYLEDQFEMMANVYNRK